MVSDLLLLSKHYQDHYATYPDRNTYLIGLTIISTLLSHVEKFKDIHSQSLREITRNEPKVFQQNVIVLSDELESSF